MIYPRRNNRFEARNKRLIYGVVITAVALFALLEFFMPQVLPAMFTAVTKPFWRLEFTVSQSGLRTEDDLLHENEKLKLELADLKAGMSSTTVGMLIAENERLYALFGRATTTPSALTAAAVLSRPPFMPYDELIIDIGSAQGVSTTSLVYAPGRVLIGHVVSALPQTSKVILYSSPKQVIQVGIGPSYIPATAIGRGGGQYSADVPHGTSIQVGDVVTDSSLHDRAFGVVVSVRTDPADPFDTVFFAPSVNIFEERFVLIKK